MKRIPLRARNGSVRGYAIVDDDDFETLNRRRWTLKMHRGGYASRMDKTGPRPRMVLMHREIVGLSIGDPRQVDHRNRNGLDNRKVNLRIASNAENHQNTGAHRGSTSNLRGVSWDRQTGRWRAQVTLHGRNRNLGRFGTEAEAAEAAAAFRRQHLPYSIEAPTMGGTP